MKQITKIILFEVLWPLILHLSIRWNYKQGCLLVIASYQYLYDFNIKCEVCNVNNYRQQQDVTIVQWIYYVWTGLIQHVVTFQHLLIYYIMSRKIIAIWKSFISHTLKTSKNCLTQIWDDVIIPFYEINTYQYFGLFI